MRAIVVHEPGGPDAMRVENVDVPEPGRDQVRVRVEAAGVNFIDVYHRTGAYQLPLPARLGMEAAGVVEAVGEEVSDLRGGERVAFAGTRGAYAETVVVPAAEVVQIPDEIDTRVAAAVMLQGLTAHYLACSTFPLEPGHTALVHAAAGGVGHLLTQIAKLRGARVVATASTQEKEQLARTAGADEVIRYTEVDFAEAVAESVGVVDVVYDSVGRDTFARSLECLRPRGTLVLYGQSSGAVDPVDPQLLNAKGSLYLTRPTLAHYTANPLELGERARDLFDWIDAGRLEVRIDQTWALDDAADAHRYLEDRRTKGKLLLLP